MKTFYTNLKFCLLAFSFIGISTASLFAQTSITAIGDTYTQNFNTLTSAGTWNDNSTILNWYAINADGNPSSTFVLNDGNVSSAELTSFGTVASSDRALGFAPLGNVDNWMYVGWHLKNNTTQNISSFIVKWRGEQWRVENIDTQQIDLLFYKPTSSVSTIDINALQNQGHFFDSKKSNLTSQKLDGNLTENNEFISDTIYQTLAPGDEVMIVWRFFDNGANQLLAIDDIAISAREVQTINNFTLPTGKIFGDANFTTSATASSSLPITYTSSNPNVAIGVGNTISIKGPGSSTITAHQTGNSLFSPVSLVSGNVLTIKPKTPVLSEVTGVSTTGFTVNYTAENGSTGGNIRYVLEYSLNSDLNAAGDRSSLTASANTTQASISGLTPNRVYYYRLRSREFSGNAGTSNYSGYTTSSAITTGSDYRSNGDGEWTDANKWQIDLGGGNWSVNSTNAIANSIEIRNNTSITAGGPITTNSLLIRSNAKLTTSQQILVTNQLVVEVDALGNSGQIWNTGNITVGANARLIVRKTFSNPLKWQFMGFPFNVASADVFNGGSQTALNWGDLNSGADYVVQQYNGNTRASAGTANYNGQGIHWGNVSSKTFTANRGYIIYKNSAGTIDFTSRGSNIGNFFSINGASVTTDRHNSNEEHRDWNLIISPLSTK
jgi:hypothetical protein